MTKTLNSSYTVRYAPPEFILDLNIAGLFSDVWSIGLILCHIYYGVDLWNGKKENEIIESIKNEDLPSIEYNREK